MSNHGPLFDEFHRQPGHGHGGSTFDEGFDRNPGKQTPHGALYDDNFRDMARVSGHGDRWDEFDWQAMPAKHGQSFDSDFGQPTALENGEHGTWMDVFRGGTHMRYMQGGRDLEGVVIRCTPTHVVVQQRYGENQGGRREPVELGLGQIQAWRWANEQSSGKRQPVAHPGNTPADVPDRLDSPSLSARGGGRETAPSPGSKVANKTVDETDEDLIEKAFDELAILEEDEEVTKASRRGSPTPAGATTGTRHKTTKAPRHPNGKVDTASARRILADRSAAFRAGAAAKREKTLPKINHGGFTCTGCGHHSFRRHPVAAPSGGVHKQIAMHGCASCGLLHPHRVGKTDPVVIDIAKTVDTTETAVIPEGGGTVEKVGHRSGCPRGGSAPCGADVDGKCTACGATVHDHEATGKTVDPLLEVRKIARLADQGAAA